MVRSLISTLFAFTLLACGGDSDVSRGSSGGTDEAPVFQPIAGGVEWTAEEPFVYERPANEMRDAQYSVRGANGAVLTVSHFGAEEGGGGDVAENVNRWTGQFRDPTSREVERRRINDLWVTTVNVSGTFVGRQGMGGAAPPRAGWRMRGAIVESPEGLVFFKLLGPGAGLDLAGDAFDELVASIHPA